MITYETKSERLWSNVEKRHRLIVDEKKGKYAPITESCWCGPYCAMLVEGQLKIVWTEEIPIREVKVNCYV